MPRAHHLRRASRRFAALTAVTLLGASVLGCGSEESARTGDERRAGQSRYATVASDAVRDVAAGKAVLLDVRTPEEFEQGHAAEVVHLPLTRMEAGARPDIPKDAKVYVYCRTGRRAAIAAELLRADGYKDVTNIGGLTDWQRAGGATRS